MFALVAVVAFVVAMVNLDSVHVWNFWLLLGLLALAVDSVWTFSYGWHRDHRRGVPPQ